MSNIWPNDEAKKQGGDPFFFDGETKPYPAGSHQVYPTPDRSLVTTEKIKEEPTPQSLVLMATTVTFLIGAIVILLLVWLVLGILFAIGGVMR